MTTYVFPITSANTVPDVSGNCWQEPYTVLATNDAWGALVWRFGASNSAEPTTRIGLRGIFRVPENYVGSATIVIDWTATATTGNVVWDFDYRAVGGDDAESMDQAGTQESVTVTDAAPTAANRLLQPTISLTSSNLAAGDMVEYELFRDGADGSDTMAASAILFNVYFSYADA